MRHKSKTCSLEVKFPLLAIMLLQLSSMQPLLSDRRKNLFIYLGLSLSITRRMRRLRLSKWQLLRVLLYLFILFSSRQY